MLPMLDRFWRLAVLGCRRIANVSKSIPNVTTDTLITVVELMFTSMK
jgi:hypothetical protein